MEPLEQDLARFPAGYRRAIEKALDRVPTRNGVVSIRDLWLETALPMDLITDLLQADGIALPAHVVRVDCHVPARRARHGRKQ